MSLIEARGLAKTFGGETVLHGVDLQVERGEIVTIVGPNGSGKSTLLRMLAGVLQPDKGQITHASGLKIGYVPQKLSLEASLPMTVRRFLNVPRRVSEADAVAALELANRALILDMGQIVFDGTAQSVLDSPDLRKEYLAI